MNKFFISLLILLFSFQSFSNENQKMEDLQLASLKVLVSVSAYEKETLDRLLKYNDVYYDHAMIDIPQAFAFITGGMAGIVWLSYITGFNDDNMRFAANDPVMKWIFRYGLVMLGLYYSGEYLKDSQYAHYFQGDHVVRKRNSQEALIKKNVKVIVRRLSRLLEIHDPQIKKNLQKNISKAYITKFRDSLIDPNRFYFTNTDHNMDLTKVMLESGVSRAKLDGYLTLQEYFKKLNNSYEEIKIDQAFARSRQHSADQLLAFSRGLLRELKQSDNNYDSQTKRTIEELEMTLKSLGVKVEEAKSN